ncbi:MAG TPA: response regulator transcription factor [Ktedonobacterales bacterium]|nr:response regulator transcription factor [Ktedonobacterales bacterium]
MRIFVLSPYPTVRAGLRAVVSGHAGWLVVGESSSAALAGTGGSVSASATTQVDVLLADVDDPATLADLGALTAAVQPRAGLVAVGAEGGNATLRGVVASATGSAGWLGALGLGLLPRDAAPEDIVATLDAVGRGLVVLDRELAGALAAPTRAEDLPSAAAAPAEAHEGPLTARELEVLQLLAEGLPNKIIAVRLKVSEHTAKFHVASIMTKLGAASRTEAVTLAARRGLLLL